MNAQLNSGAHRSDETGTTWRARACRCLLTVPLKSMTTVRSYGFFGVRTRLLTYSPTKVPHVEHIGGFLGFEMGAFHDKWLWIPAFLCGALCVLIGLLTPTDAAPEVQAERVEVVTRLASEMSTLVAFLLGGFVLKAVGVWQERRTNYASLVGSMRNLLVQLSSLVALTPALPQEPSESDRRLIVESRRTLARYVLLACELAVLKARGHMDSEQGREHLTQLGLVSHAEWSAMAVGDRHTSVLCWVQSMCVGLSRRGLLDKQELPLIAKAISGARGQANDLMSSLNRDLPLPYANLVAWLVSINLAIEAITFGLLFAEISDGMARFYCVVSVLLYGIFFLAFLALHKVLHNPFLDRLIDVAHEPIVTEGLGKLAHALMSEEAFLPPGYPNLIGDVQRASSGV